MFLETMVSPPKRMTTAELRAMIGAGAKREDLPTKSNGRSVVSTRDSAGKAYREALAKEERTRQFKLRQKTLTAKKFFTPVKNTQARDLMRQRELLLKAGIKGTTLDLRTDREITVNTSIPIRKNVNYTGQAEFNPQVKSKSSDPKVNEFEFPLESVLFNPDVNISEKKKDDFDIVETTKKAGLGAGVAVAGGIIVYLMSKGKIL